MAILKLYIFEYYIIYIFYAQNVKNKINGVEKFLLLDSFVFLLSMCIQFCRVWNSEFHTRKLHGNVDRYTIDCPQH